MGDAPLTRREKQSAKPRFASFFSLRCARRVLTYQKGTVMFMNNCLCNLFDGNNCTWIIILALIIILFSCCCG